LRLVLRQHVDISAITIVAVISATTSAAEPTVSSHGMHVSSDWEYPASQTAHSVPVCPSPHKTLVVVQLSSASRSEAAQNSN
jgi:hypothetical protein